VALQLIDRNGPEGDDIVEIEMLARKALRIKEKIYGLTYFTLIPNLSTLDNVLKLKGNCEKERKDVMERCV
jgi:predicted ABC-type transport system involved in lysophospholipase L1 biosynthesis ATPase subunit